MSTSIRLHHLYLYMGLPSGVVVKNPHSNAGDSGPIPGSGRSPGEENDNPFQYSCLGNPWTEEHGRLQSMGSLRVGHDRATSLSLFTFVHWRRKWQRTPVFLPGKPMDRGACWALVHGFAKNWTQLSD